MTRRSLPLAVVLAAAVLVPVAASGGGPDWKALQRPLHLPTLAPGGRCPASKAAPQITGKRYGVDGAVGPGPVYPMLGRSSLFAVFRPAEWGAWAGQKVLWFVLPDYKGPVLIRGRRLGSSRLMRFDDGTNPPSAIRIWSGQTVTWTGQVPGSRGRPSYVRVRVPGCYGVQIDGTSFSTVVVFPVSPSHSRTSAERRSPRRIWAASPSSTRSTTCSSSPRSGLTGSRPRPSAGTGAWRSSPLD